MRYGFRGVVADPEENEMEDLTELGKDDFEEELGGKFVWKIKKLFKVRIF